MKMSISDLRTLVRAVRRGNIHKTSRQAAGRLERRLRQAGTRPVAIKSATHHQRSTP